MAKAKERALEPIFVVRESNEHDMKLLKSFFGRKSMESGIIPGVYGPQFANTNQEIKLRGALASLLQKLHDEREKQDERS